MNKFKKKVFIFLNDQNVKIEKDVFSYGFDIIMSYLIYLSFLIPIAIHFNIVYEIFLFLLVFISLRKYMGGFHFENNILCLLFSLFITLVIPLVASRLGVISLKIKILLMIVNFLGINMFGVADSHKKKLTKKEKRNYLSKANILLVIYSFILIGFNKLIPSNYSNLVLITIIFININLFFSKIKIFNR